MAVMASEQPQTISVDQKINNVAPEKDDMVVDEPVAKAINGHATTEEVPTTNGKSPSPDRVANQQAFAANKELSAPSPVEPAPEEGADKKAGLEDSEMKDVNGIKEQALPEVPATKDETDVQAPASPPRSATPKASAADDTMDVDTPTERPDLSSSAEHADSTQNTSAVSDQAAVASPQEMSHSADVAKLDIKSPALEPKDEPMPDRAASPAKVSRERSVDEDAADEPSAKRTKLDSVERSSVEPKAEKIIDSIGVASSVLSPAPDGEVDNLVDDIPDDKPIKEYHSKEIRKELARVKKTKNGMNFRQSVEKLWPSIWENYKALIKDPVDLSLFEAKFRDNKYTTFGDFKADLRLLYENSYKFNGATNTVSIAAFRVRNDLFAKLSEVAKLEEPTKSDKGKAQPTRHVEHRAATQPRRPSHSQPRATAASPKPKAQAVATTTSTSAAAPAFALPPNGVPQIRRDSTRDDGDRPKRPIHPPKNRDPDYASQNSRKKKLEPEMKFYADVLGDLKKPKYWTHNQWFLEPVDPVAMNIPNYFSVIKKPMDLKTMTEKLEDGQYRSGKEVEKDMRQIVANSELFNGASLVTQCAQDLEKLFKEKVAEKDNWMLKNYPASNHSAPASAGSPDVSDLESEADSEAEEESSESVRNVQSRLLEEQNKLNDMLGAKKPDMTMIEIQQNVVSMLQRKLVEEKSKVGSSKKTKTQKKPSSKNKAKSSASQGAGGSTNKKASGGASAASKNRPTNNKKPASKKRHIGVMEKQVITEGISELDGPTLDRAVDIIKKDTNQKEDDDGQLELDIEVLSQDALGRLFELINKSYPNIYATVSKRPEFSNSNKAEKAEQSPIHSTNPSKPRKNKPMNKDEQERKIEQLRELKAQFQRQGSGSQEPVPEDEEQRAGNSSEESDSEEE